ncbi:GNAT family N-acetyltransferase [Streptomyces fulvoviolaceus]|uniref:GNAT family N-acetyltransferase n=1 Tax=Streptomyces fulvoviolaceus TaxID=285535 RepID=UPI0004C95604|nr:GNAT family N-acetyltransferase [Streptomyces fulvoviolaceus]
MIAPILPVVPAGRIADNAQPVLDLPGNGNGSDNDTGGLELRPWRTTDADALVAASHDPAISHWNLLPALSEDEARARIERMHERWTAETAAVWAIARPGGGEVLGLAAWIGIDLTRGNAEIAYWVLPAGRGAGIAVEAARRLTRWALDDLGLHRLTLCHSVANPASCRVAEKAGFRLEGTMRGALLHADGWHDDHLHARVRGDE